MKKYSNGVLMDMSPEEVQERKDFVKKYNEDFDGHLLGLRIRRNQLLLETDWWGASDNTMTDAQKKYRQDLRDITAGVDTVDKINAVVWPTKPW